MNKHTPGPWVADWCVDEWRVEDEHGRLVAGNIEDDRDARLIAAAPELLEALSDLMDCSEYSGWSDADLAHSIAEGDHYLPLIVAARAAIAKARQA